MEQEKIQVDALWTVEDAAAFFKSSTSYIYKLAEQSEQNSFPVIRLNGKNNLRFYPPALVQWAVKQTSKPKRSEKRFFSINEQLA